jgi:hypothetical protein
MAVAASVLLALGNTSAQQRGAADVSVDTAITVSRIAPGFLGLGYETSAVAQPDYFSGKNKVLIRLYRNLGPHGLIRIGGNISDHTSYVPGGASAVRTERQVTVINDSDLARLAAFARATGWKVMWGLNLGTGSPGQAAAEAVAVTRALDGSLSSLQIGNEVDLHHLYSHPLADFTDYYGEYLAFKAAIREALPHSRFSGPDVAGSLGWLQQFARRQAGDIRMLTCHYYRMGARNPQATLATLLAPDRRWDSALARLRHISRESGTPFRVNEVNSFSGGGKVGVSNTFGSALWCLDYLFTLASYGCHGANLETDINQFAWVSHYSPIVHDSSGACSVRPEYYGMLAFAMAGRGKLLGTEVRGAPAVTAYATTDEERPGVLWVTVINKDLDTDRPVRIHAPAGYTAAGAYRLTAPSPYSTTGVTLAGGAVSADGSWQPQSMEQLVAKRGTATINLRHGSAVLVRFSMAKGRRIKSDDGL